MVRNCYGSSTQCNKSSWFQAFVFENAFMTCQHYLQVELLQKKMFASSWWLMMEIFFRDKKNTGRESVWVGGLSFLERFSILMDWRRIYRDRFQYANRTHYPHSEPRVEEYSKACYSDQIFALKPITYIYWTLLALYIVHDPTFFWTLLTSSSHIHQNTSLTQHWPNNY